MKNVRIYDSDQLDALEAARKAETHKLLCDAILAVQALYDHLDRVADESRKHTVTKAIRILWKLE